MSHQDRRLPLPADYQFPTHGVDCDCPPCRNRVPIRGSVALQFMAGWDTARDMTVTPFDVDLFTGSTQTAYGWGV